MPGEPFTMEQANGGKGIDPVDLHGPPHTVADLSASGTRQAQQVVFEVGGVAPGKHVLSIINRGPGPVSVDALVIQ